MSQLVETKPFGTYNTSKTDGEIDTFRNDKLAMCETLDVSGYFVLGEGNTWIVLQGEHSDVYEAQKALDLDPFFHAFDTDSLDHIPRRDIEEVYLYHEDRSPITSL